MKFSFFLKQLCLLVWYLLFPYQNFAQLNIPHISEQLKTAPESRKAELLNRLAGEYRNVNVDSSEFYALQALSFVKQGVASEQQTLAYANLAYIRYYVHDLSAAKLYLDSARRSNQQKKNLTGADLLLLEALINERENRSDLSQKLYEVRVAIYDSLGLINEREWANLEIVKWIRKTDPTKGMDMYYQALNAARDRADWETYYDAIHGIAILNYALNNFEESTRELHEVYSYAKRKGDLREQAALTHALALQWIGRDKDSVNYYFDKSIALNKQLKYYYALELNYEVIGGINRGVDREKSWRYLDMADSLRHRYGLNPPRLSLIIGKGHFVDGKINLAIKMAQEAYDQAIKSGQVYVQFQAAYDLYKYHKANGEFGEAIHFLEEYQHYTDSVRSSKHHTEIGRLETKLAYDKELIQKQLQEEVLVAENEQQKLMIILAFATVVALTAIFFLLYFSHKRNVRSKNIITAQKVSLERMDVLNKNVFSVIAHDFQGPLLSMTLMADVLERGRLAPGELAIYAKDIKNQVSQTQQILQSLLNWARAELQVDFPSQHASDVHAICNEIIVQLSDMVHSKSIRVVNNIPADQHSNIHADILRIALRNLVTNAIKYSHEGSEVTLGFKPEAGAYFVEDKGIGMSREKINRLFKESINSALGTKNETGFGLGLYITFELLRKSGWNLLVESTENEGTIFSFMPVKISGG